MIYVSKLLTLKISSLLSEFLLGNRILWVRFGFANSNHSKIFSSNENMEKRLATLQKINSNGKVNLF